MMQNCLNGREEELMFDLSFGLLDILLSVFSLLKLNREGLFFACCTNYGLSPGTHLPFEHVL